MIQFSSLLVFVQIKLLLSLIAIQTIRLLLHLIEVFPLVRGPHPIHPRYLLITTVLGQSSFENMVTIKNETPLEGSTSASTRAQQAPTQPPHQYTVFQLKANPLSQAYEQQLKDLEAQNAKRLRMARAEKQQSSATFQQEVKMESLNSGPVPPSNMKAGGWPAWPGPSFPPSGSRNFFASGLASGLHFGNSLQDYQTQLELLKMENETRNQKKDHGRVEFIPPYVPTEMKTSPQTLTDFRHFQQDYEMQLLLLKQQNDKRKMMEAMERQQAGNTRSADTPRTDDSKPHVLGGMNRLKEKGLRREWKDLLCIKAELAFTRDCIIRFRQNRQKILALEQNNTTLDPSSISGTQHAAYILLTQQTREKEDETIKNHFISRGSEPPNDLFEICPEKWDEDCDAMEKLLVSFQDLWASWQDENFRKGEDLLYSIKDCVRNYLYPEDHSLHPPLKPIQKLGQEVGRKVAMFIITQVILEQRNGVPTEFSQRYLVPDPSWLDETIVRELESASALGRNREWLGRQVNLQLEEREKGRAAHFCGKMASKVNDGKWVCSQEGTGDSQSSGRNISSDGTISGWPKFTFPSSSTREGTTDSEGSRLNTPAGSTREGTVDSEWAKLDTPMEGTSDVENEVDGFEHVLPIRSADIVD